MRELVQVERPDPIDGPRMMIRETAYNLCALAAQSLNVPVKPFPKAPGDYVSERTTIITDGSNYVRKIEHPYNENTDKMSPETGCEYRIEPSNQVDIAILNGGKMTTVSRDANGKWRTEDGVAAGGSLAAKKEDLSSYSDSFAVNGVKLRCLPASSGLISANETQALCVDGSDQALSTTDGNAMVLYSRIKPLGNDPRFPYVVIKEPLSLKQLDKVDGKIFDPATYTK
ncbi:hypothetical protein CAter282_2886 [Collimonas arenae]|uniref:Uncharacterized protein n=1 Tax=Collimonas arenae TaxID=279058 RepID=A0A127PSC4_9BURK|nr:hypothetical protein [Collimonas arenae]AMP00720.1 hypothetical protein CAter10_3179 [Collimonas arenae]AMP10610.1 hypothetical protein CAter282_2886 [Collimonas arenae]